MHNLKFVTDFTCSKIFFVTFLSLSQANMISSLLTRTGQHHRQKRFVNLFGVPVPVLAGYVL